MTDSREVRETLDPVAEFGKRIDRLRREGAYDHWRGAYVAWAEATEGLKLNAIVGEALSASVTAPTVAGHETLTAVEQNIDYAGLPAWQRDMLHDVRAKLDAGQLDGPHHGRMNRAWKALDRIVAIDKFDRWLERYKAEGLYDRPSNTPWTEVPEARKVSAIVGLAQHEGPPGAYAVAAIEREVDYGKLPPWRREALEGLRAAGCGPARGRPAPRFARPRQLRIEARRVRGPYRGS